MGPFHAGLRELGLSPWVVERLWLGTLWFLAAWGVVKLVDALWRRERGTAHVVAAAAFVLNPYVLTYTSRVSVSLLAYAALPWLLLAVHRGLREPRSWLWPAAFALIVTSSGGGINAAVTAWVLVGPLLLLIYEPALGLAGWRAARSFALRAALLGALTSLWWVVPLVVQAKWGLPFLPYTEQPGTIWQTTSVTESLRLMGFWLSYVGTGYGGRLAPYTSDAAPLLFLTPVVVATLAVPAAALAGFAWTRRWRYGPFFLALVLAGVLVMVAGFPEGTPLRSAMTFAYNHLVSLQFLRTTYKAGPLAALGLAMLAGVAAAHAWAWLRSRRPAVARLAFAGVTAVALALCAWPMLRGRAVDDKLTFERVPAAWRAAAAGVDRAAGADGRTMVLPGQLFSAYTWGTTVDPILPTLARTPVAVRQVVPFADLRSVELQWATDALVSQRRGVPGQLPRMLDLLGVQQVVAGADDDRARSGALGANAAARELSRQGLETPVAGYGDLRTVGAQAGDLAAPLDLPEVRRYEIGGGSMVRLLPRATATVVDGAAGGVLGLQAFGGLAAGAPLRYAADVPAAELRRLAARGARIVVSDSNRRQVFVPSRLRGNVGAVLAPGDPISEDGHQLDPFADAGTDAQTVARLDGVRYVRAPFSPQVTQFPEHRPFAALDGDPRTAWLADRTLARARWHLDVGLPTRRDVGHIDLLPYGDARGRVRAVEVNGRRFAVHPGWNRLRVGLRGIDELSVRMADVTRPAVAAGGAGGIRELRIPGVRAGEALRPPVLAERALRGAALGATPLTYLFERARGDDPYHRDVLHGPWSAGEVRDQGDAERGMARVLSPPAARSWRAQAWLSVAPDADDAALDALAGLRGGAVGAMRSSSRYEGQARWRASSALDGRADTAWVGGWLGPARIRPAGAGHGAWLGWTTARPATLSRLVLVPVRARVRRPTLVRLVSERGESGAVAVSPGGEVVLDRPVSGRRFRLDVLAAAFPPGTSGADRRRRAVGVAEVRAPGLPRVAVPRTGALQGGCDVPVAVGGHTVALHAEGSISDLDAGRPLPARSCAAPVALPAGEQRLTTSPAGPLRVDLLELDSPAPAPVAAVAPAGRVADAGTPGRGRRDGIRLDVTAPAWLVLGESYSAGWRASCAGRSLGAPVPIDGYSAGWPVEPGCRTVDVVFAGNRPVTLSGFLSLAASLVLLGLVAVGLRRRRNVVAPPAIDALPDPAPARMPLRRALAWGVAAALAGGFVYALRAGVLIGPAVAFVLWRGIGARALALAAGALLGIVVPLVYALFPAEDKGGFNSNAPVELIGAHWVGVAAMVLLWLALYRALAAAGVRLRPRRPSTSTPPAATT
jgi:hypothetical protein